MPIGPPMTIFVVFIWIIPPPPVVVMLPSVTTVPLESLMRTHEAVPVASADESEVTASRVSTPAAIVPHGSENVSVPSKTCDVTAVAGSAGIVPVSVSYTHLDVYKRQVTVYPTSDNVLQTVSTAFCIVRKAPPDVFARPVLLSLPSCLLYTSRCV